MARPLVRSLFKQSQKNGIYRSEVNSGRFCICYVLRRPKTVNNLWLNDVRPEEDWEKIVKVDFKDSSHN